MFRNKKLTIALSIIPQYIVVKILSAYPNFVESVYSNGIYVFVSKAFRFLFGWIPFSVGDILYTLAIIYCLRWLYKKRRLFRKTFRYWLVNVVSVISLVYFGFHLFWGMNYYRVPLHEKLELDNQYTTEELIEVTKTIIKKANHVHLQVSESDSLKVEMPYTTSEMIDMTQNGYQNLRETYAFLNPSPVSVKKSIYSIPLTYMGFSGYLNPFTNEAQVDAIIPKHRLPTTIAHEQGHQIGYAAENETNFIGFLATIHNDDVYFKYSGYTFALRHCLNEIYRRDKEQYEQIITEINPGILKNFQESYDFWSSYQNPLEPFFKNFYSYFLKANNQSKGIQSYSYVVALIVNYIEISE